MCNASWVVTVMIKDSSNSENFKLTFLNDQVHMLFEGILNIDKNSITNDCELVKSIVTVQEPLIFTFNAISKVVSSCKIAIEC